MFTIPKICAIKTCVGLGDIIYIKQLLDDTKHFYNTIKIVPDKDTISSSKNNFTDYFKFLYNMFDDLFSELPYEITYSHEFTASRISHFQYINFLKNTFNITVTPKIPNLEKYFCKNTPHLKNNNILITTKIRGIPKFEYENIKFNFYELLNKISKKYNLILIGEKTIGTTPEYETLETNSIFSIYDDLVKYLKNYQDETVPTIMDDTPKYSKFIDDCNKMHNSKRVITLGFGGNAAIAMSVSSIINYFGNSTTESHCIDYFKSMSKSNFTKFLTNDIQQFYYKLEELT